MKIAAAVIGSLLALAALSLALGGWSYITAPFRGMVQAENQIESGPSRIGFYNRFHDLCAGVQALEAQIQVQSDPQNVAGLQARRAQVISQYNADARKDYTAARFRDADLPYQLSVDTPTTC